MSDDLMTSDKVAKLLLEAYERGKREAILDRKADGLYVSADVLASLSLEVKNRVIVEVLSLIDQELNDGCWNQKLLESFRNALHKRILSLKL